jgi:hypothetical protein
MAFVESYDLQTKALKKEALKMCWYMRGGLTYEESMSLSDQEKAIIADIVKDNMEVTKKSGLPFF